MVLREELSCLWTLSVCLVAGKPPPRGPSITDQSFIDECVTVHNEMRGRVEPPAANMKHMTWDEGLARTAKAWTKKCKFQHNTCLSKSHACHPTFHHVGENLWLGAFSIFTPRSAIVSWYKEDQFYNINNLSCSKVCGHYTQVVWANSYKVGCAITVCSNPGKAPSAVFVCNYGPAGNYRNVAPYSKGASCSKCAEGDTCGNKLCHNKERDKLKSMYQNISVLIQLLPPLETTWSS
ncbi:PREDICTED: GLIPR1-like protein 1 [Ceratotherium simum simum]|uniref:GLIPR1-like protein 1 n=1 Tax=Ceratotherium simum simum TaxID=73337 RepID=A0ABM0H378_CERSS|nr:PREDICTED: GLIPR1-like protein 1 [Ceratotherium simum simum]